MKIINSVRVLSEQFRKFFDILTSGEFSSVTVSSSQPQLTLPVCESAMELMSSTPPLLILLSSPAKPAALESNPPPLLILISLPASNAIFRSSPLPLCILISFEEQQTVFDSSEFFSRVFVDTDDSFSFPSLFLLVDSSSLLLA